MFYIMCGLKVHLFEWIGKCKDQIMEGFKMRVDVRNMSFWFSNWSYLGQLGSIMDDVHIPDSALRVRYIWSHEGWRWNRLHTIVPHYVKDFLANMLLYLHEDVHDVVCWQRDVSGEYKVVSAYHWLMNRSSIEAWGFSGIIKGGSWIRGFYGNIGQASIFYVKAIRLFQGLIMARNMEVGKMEVRTDSLKLVWCIKTWKCPSFHCYLSLLQHIYDLLKLDDWEVSVVNIFREGNFCADWLAKHGVASLEHLIRR
ncbi:hypothetical protein RJT34_13343 [Clitoria ternatea]|uniref:RNase H type-1 domain-containing protein n=1 Tax=Clitoria ternatea TaxID=43366 RepID=A0AAN9JNU5_CLITE